MVCVVAVAAPPPAVDLRPSDDQTVTDRLLNKMEKEQTNFDVQIGDGMDIGIVGENGNILLMKDAILMCFPGDVKNPKLSVALNHFQAATIMSSFQNMTSFPNHNISEFPFNDSIRLILFFHSGVFKITFFSFQRNLLWKSHKHT